jgi:trigger factor
MPNKKSSYISNIEEKEGGIITISASLPWKILLEERKTALINLGKEVTLPGFRTGHVPTSILEKALGEAKIIEEAARISIREHYTEIVSSSEKELIGTPSISITKLEPEIGLEFTIQAWKSPEISLSDYKKIAETTFKQVSETCVDDKEVDEAIQHLRTQWARSEKWEQMKLSTQQEAKLVDNSQRSYPAFHEVEVNDDELPVLNDEFVSKISSFNTVAEFKESFKESIKQEKELSEAEARLTTLLDEIVDSSTFSVPHLLIEGEKARIAEEFNHSLKNSGASFDEYLKEAKKSKSDIESEWEKAAIKRIHTQLTLMEIARTEKLHVSEEEVHREAHHLLTQHKDADKDAVHNHVRTILTNRAAISFISSLRSADNKPAKASTKLKPKTAKEKVSKEKSPSPKKKTSTKEKSSVVKKDSVEKKKVSKKKSVKKAQE